jgi:hypothetical protein
VGHLRNIISTNRKFNYLQDLTYADLCSIKGNIDPEKKNYIQRLLVRDIPIKELPLWYKDLSEDSINWLKNRIFEKHINICIYEVESDIIGCPQIKHEKYDNINEWILKDGSFMFIAKSSFTDSLNAIIGFKATRQDLLKCFEFILFYKLPYCKQAYVAKEIEGLEFGTFRKGDEGDDCDVVAGLSAPHEDLSVVRPWPDYYDIDVAIYRSSIGFQCFWSTMDGKRKAMRFIEDHPRRDRKDITFRGTGTKCLNPREFILDMRKNPYKLRELDNYNQLLGLYNASESLDEVTPLLRLSHYKIYKERPDVTAIVLCGPSGIGKTQLVTRLCEEGNYSLYQYFYDPKAKGFMNGYCGQDIVFFDDIGHHKIEEWLKLLQLVSNGPAVPVENSDLNKADEIPFVSPLIVLTTNCLEKLVNSKLDSTIPLLRRIEVITVKRGLIDNDTCERSPNTYDYETYNPSERKFQPILSDQPYLLLRPFIEGFIGRIPPPSGVGTIAKYGMAPARAVYDLLGILPYGKYVQKVIDCLVQRMWVTGGVTVLVIAGAILLNRRKLKNYVPRKFRSEVKNLPSDVRNDMNVQLKNLWDSNSRIKYAELSEELVAKIFKEKNTISDQFVSEEVISHRENKGIISNLLSACVSRPNIPCREAMVKTINVPAVNLDEILHRHVKTTTSGTPMAGYTFIKDKLPKIVSDLFETSNTYYVPVNDEGHDSVVLSMIDMLKSKFVNVKTNDSSPNRPTIITPNWELMARTLRASNSNNRTIKRRERRKRNG